MKALQFIVLNLDLLKAFLFIGEDSSPGIVLFYSVFWCIMICILRGDWRTYIYL